MARDLILNLCIVLFPIFVYEMFLVDRLKDKWVIRELIIAALSGFTSVLCMTFPISIGNGFILDLRWVPFITSFLYSGLYTWMINIVVIVGYRIFIGNGAAFTVVSTAAILSVFIYFLKPIFLNSSRHKKLIFGLVIATFSYLVVIVTSLLYSAFLNDIAGFLLINITYYIETLLCAGIAMWISIFLIETVRESTLMRDEMQRMEKLNLISELAASIAHEIRNPLTVVRGFIQLAQRTMDEQNKSYMKTAIQELDRAEFIISDYLNFARPQMERIEQFDLSEQMQSVVEMISLYATMHGSEIVQDGDQYIKVQGDILKFKQAMMNLIKNAIEAMPNGGIVRILYIRVLDRVKIQISDTGEGMCAEQLKLLGNPFYSTKEKGTGLGLMVTFRIFEAMNGKLEFESEKGKGTTATIYLPLVY